MLQFTRPGFILACAILSVGMAASACNVLNPIACTLEYRYGVYGEVTDAAGEPIPGITVQITSGTYVEDATIFNKGEYAGAGERPGTYAVTFSAPGYQPRTVSGVVVTADECHVTPVRVDAVLTRL